MIYSVVLGLKENNKQNAKQVAKCKRKYFYTN